MKRKITVAALLVICLSLLTYGTIAFFTAKDTAHNVIESGNLAIDLLEWADEEKTVPFPEEGISDVMPGSEITKIAEVKNTGSSAAYIRVKVEKAITLAAGVEGEPDPGMLKIEVDTNYWTLRDPDDGYYYYKEPLAPGATTEPLFASVEFDKDMDNIYQNCTATVDVKAYAVQVANNGTDVFDATGWPTE